MFRRLAHVKEEGSPLGVDHGHPNFLELRQRVVRRTRVRRTSQNYPSETVWKIAEGLSTALLWRQEAADRLLFAPPGGLTASVKIIDPGTIVEA
jgi:hypothetical protein